MFKRKNARADGGGQSSPNPNLTRQVESPPVADPAMAPATLKKAGRRFNLPNGTVGRSYAHSISLPIEGFSAVRVLEVNGLDQIGGLEFDVVNQSLSGAPRNQGSYSLELLIQAEAAMTSSAHPNQFTRDAVLLVNPDPRSLWKELPSDQTAPYQKPDTACIRETDGPCLLVVASKRGRSHAHEGKFREDDFDVRYVEQTGWYVMAVADGAGSAKYSRRGSQVACQLAGRFLADATSRQLGEKFEQSLAEFQRDQTEQHYAAVFNPLYEVLGKAAFEAMEGVEKEAAARNAHPRDFGTTLLLVVSKQFRFGHFVGAYWKGDGGVAVWDARAGKVHALGQAESGEYAGQTRFLLRQEFGSTEDVVERIKFGIYDRHTAVVAMTDGVTDPKFETDNNFADDTRWRGFWEDDLTRQVKLSKDNPEVAAELLAWLDFWSPGNHDDRTIAILSGEE